MQISERSITANPLLAQIPAADRFWNDATTTRQEGTREHQTTRSLKKWVSSEPVLDIPGRFGSTLLLLWISVYRFTPFINYSSKCWSEHFKCLLVPNMFIQAKKTGVSLNNLLFHLTFITSVSVLSSLGFKNVVFCEILRKQEYSILHRQICLSLWSLWRITIAGIWQSPAWVPCFTLLFFYYMTER